MSCIYLTVRHCVPASWMNDRDQYLSPNEGWKSDELFQGDCLTYALFTNVIQEKFGANHWIPYSEEEVDAKDRFTSHFMWDFIHGRKSCEEAYFELANNPDTKNLSLGDDFVSEPITSPSERKPILFSAKAKRVMDAGLEVWRYYHKQPDASPNASLYDIRMYFQGCSTTKSGKLQMNTDSPDTEYMNFLTTLRKAVKSLAEAIEPKVYQYGFLLK